MIDSISNTAIKLALIQTVPGEEFNVKNKLKEACEQEPKIKKSIFLKALGCFDIIVIYLTDDFGYHLSKAGPISNILKSNLLLCYSYLSSDIYEMFESIKSNSFTGFSLLKINPGFQQRYNPEIEKSFRAYLGRKKGEGFLMGSLGWNEMILLISENDLNSLTQKLLSTSTVYLRQTDGKRSAKISALVKTLSFLGINYENIPKFDIKKAGFKRTKLFLEQNPFLRITNVQIDKNDRTNSPIIEVATKPMYTAKIKSFFSTKGFQSHDLLGKQDLILIPAEEMTWAHFISSVLLFRHEFKKKVFSTSIRLRSDTIGPDDVSYKELKLKIPPISFSFEQLEKDYNDIIAAGLSNCFYSFNSLSQNPICGSAFIDMVDYPRYILDAGPQMPEKLEFAHVAREVIRYGAELRSYGTFETIEEVTGKFSELRGGCQTSLLAIEYLPTFVFKSIGEQWSGFVITHQSNKFDHVNEVIRIPTDTLWKPQKWWALYHEIGHILIENDPKFIDKHLIEQFLRNRTHPEYWTKLIIELAAEIIGFELGFFGDYNTFFKLFWKHIVEIDPLQRNVIPIQTYALRSFFTKLFLGCFRKYRGILPIYKRNFTDLQFLYNKFIEHLNEIKLITRNALGQTYAENCFLAAENAKALEDLYPIAHDLSKKISSLPPQSRPSARHLSEPETKSILRRLNAGKIWWDKISCPQAVIYYLIQDDLIKDQKVEFAKRIATLLTFWNQQMILIGNRFK